MKKLLLILVGLALCGSTVLAQNPVFCDENLIQNNSTIQFGAFPDTTTNFAPAFVNNPYTQMLHFRIPNDAADVLPAFAGNMINYFTVVDVQGLPAGLFTYECSTTTPPCQFNGGTWGCAQVRNIATIPASAIGTYNIIIKVSGNVSFSPVAPPIDIPYEFTGYKLRIFPEEQLGVSTLEYDVNTLYPNPATSVVFMDQLTDIQVIKFYNVAGQEVKTIVPTATQMTIDVTDLTKGTYIVYAFSVNGANVQKLIKN